ncbi:hypothetical protein THRCLA_05771 [Thraustotheca clavata]|uniref:Ribosomal RNA-processing protein 14/surfeit locus protein 6 C-terminal domain-containing protein n=1 Tax=Thraustotheca clavata TaxID=74557 RepID=A0A1V9ZTB5_9STRA|nr:hypothetical protein THRCLA_05771 [Thraustotheca clavata]
MASLFATSHLKDTEENKPPQIRLESKKDLMSPAMDYEAVDRFFCHVMELIPSAQYFPTEPEDNFKQSMNKKYHKNVKAQQMAVEEDEEAAPVAKRLKFNPKLQRTNEETQLDEKEKEKAKAEQSDDEELTGLDGLRKRLARRIEKMRAKRQTTKEHKKTKKEKPAAVAEEKPKKRKAPSGNHEKSEIKKSKPAKAEEETKVDVSGEEISYGSLLLGQEKKEEKKTRNGRSIHGIQNLLKKAEANKARMEELKQTEEGRAVVQAKGWEKAMKQASGGKVMDDPKLLRNKLKKKLKQKEKSSKEWKQRVATEKKGVKERAKKKATNARAGKKQLRSAAAEARAEKIKASKPAGNRAGFEGKKGESFLNAKK